MDACIDRTGTVEGLERVLHEACTRLGAEGILLLTCDGNDYEARTINPVLGRVGVPVAGGLFPSVIAGGEILERGSIAISLPMAPRVLALGREDFDDSGFRELISNHLRPDEDDSGGVISRNFCLAINRLDGDFVVREPVKVCDDGSLEFAAEMRENELVDVVRADRDRVPNAAVAARNGAHKDLRAAPRTNLCFTCCARRMFLGGDFAEEVQSIASAGVPLFGAITVGGEIANNGESYLDYYNRTCVVGAFEV